MAKRRLTKSKRQSNQEKSVDGSEWFQDQIKEVLAILLFFSGLFVWITVHFPNTTGLLGY